MENQEDGYKKQLYQKLDQLKNEIRSKQAEIQEATNFVEKKQDQVESVLKLLVAEGEAIDRTELDGILPISLADIVTKFLRENKEPMHYKALTEAIQIKGHKIPGQNPAATLISLLHRRRDLFIRSDAGMWGMTEWNLAQPKLVRRRKKKSRRSKRRTG